MGESWRTLFRLVIFQARKPHFFTHGYCYLWIVIFVKKIIFISCAKTTLDEVAAFKTTLAGHMQVCYFFLSSIYLKKQTNKQKIINIITLIGDSSRCTNLQNGKEYDVNNDSFFRKWNWNFLKTKVFGWLCCSTERIVFAWQTCSCSCCYITTTTAIESISTTIVDYIECNDRCGICRWSSNERRSCLQSIQWYYLP